MQMRFHLAAIIEFVQQENVAEDSSYDEATMVMLYDRRKIT